MPAPDRRANPGDKISVKPLSSSDRPVRRTFPGPAGAEAKLRVAIHREPYADLVAHAKSSLDAEVCGVLVGQIAEDDSGLFVLVEAIIRGNSATQQSTSVTFTQATWDAIHHTLEKEHPKKRIVGWYHTHPGFGVQFSEMDLFIQRNFFSGPTQIALVTDPLSGAVAVIINVDGEVEYLPRLWIDGREQTAQVPVQATAESEPAAATPAAIAPDTLRQLEGRIGQLVQANDDLHALVHRVVLTLGLLAGMAIIFVASYFLYRQYTAPLEPPRINGFAPVPVQIGDKRVLLGVGVVEWDVPPELNALLLQMAQKERDDAAKAKAKASDKDKAPKDDKTAAPAPATPPAPAAEPAPNDSKK